jgi:hypothetical protein
MVASLHNVLKGVGDGSSTGSHSQTGHTAFEGGNAVFEHALGGVGQTTIDISGIAETETVGGVLRVMEYIRRGLVDGHGASVGCGVSLFLAYVELQSLETIIFLCHNLFLSFYLLVFYLITFDGAKVQCLELSAKKLAIFGKNT